MRVFPLLSSARIPHIVSEQRGKRRRHSGRYGVREQSKDSGNDAQVGDFEKHILV